MTWGTLVIGDDYDSIVKQEDADRYWVTSQLLQHPLLKSGVILDEGLEVKPQFRSETQKAEPTDLAVGWFDSTFGIDANDLVKNLRRRRRVHKAYRDEIDDTISLIRLLKTMEVDSTLQAIPWIDGYEATIKSLGVSDRDLKSLRKFAISREVSLKQACLQWDNANEVITKLTAIDDLNADQRNLWAEAAEQRLDAKKMWRNTLHQTDNLNKDESSWLAEASTLLLENGPMASRQIVERLIDHDARNKSLTVQKMGALLKMYGGEYDIVRNGTRWECEEINQDLLLKDPWAYAAGFLDADGYITITKRGEPRAGMIATGARGRVHCEQMHKTLGCGILQLDLKIHKNSRRSQHRLQFYGADDLRKLLKGVSPHLRLKKTQANAVLELLSLRGRGSDIAKNRRVDLYRVVKYANWQDVRGKELLDEWKVDEQDLISMEAIDPEVIRLVDDAENLMSDI